jgi:hypothetical protein
MDVDSEIFDQQVRAYIYDSIFTQGAVPTARAIAAGLACGTGDVVAAVRRLAQGHVLVLEGNSDDILMANPFSAVPTPFAVDVDGRVYWGNCVWDALGILAMVKSDGRVVASCGDCNAAITLTVRDGEVVDSPDVAHFSVPARHWWDNIVFT